jgi:magnesium transporter
LWGTPASTTSPPAPTTSARRRSGGSFDDEDESGRQLDLALLPRASRRNLQRQKRARVVEMKADGKQTTLFLRMRELQNLIRDAVPKARQPSTTDLQKRKAHNALHPRDLRAVDATNPHACKNPSVVVRQHVIVCNLPPLRCVVVWDRLLALLPADDDELADELQRQLADQLYPTDKPISEDALSIDEATAKDSSLSLAELDDEAPFELRALEAVLRTCTLRLDAACEEVEPAAEGTMRELQTARQVQLASLERLRHVKNAVSHLEARTRDTAEALEAILDEDEDMCMMRLSLLRERPQLFDPPISPELLTQHEDVELLLESYLQDAEAVQTRLELIRLRIDNAEDLFGMKLDLARNRLITADTIFTLLGMVVGAGAMVGGFFGMNLHHEKTSFITVCVVTASALLVSTAFVFWYLIRSGTLVLA